MTGMTDMTDHDNMTDMTHERFPEGKLRKGNQLFIPPHKFATLENALVQFSHGLLKVLKNQTQFSIKT